MLWYSAARHAQIAAGARSPEVSCIYSVCSVAKKLGGGEVEEVEAGSINGAPTLTQGGVCACVCEHQLLSVQSTTYGGLQWVCFQRALVLYLCC